MTRRVEVYDAHCNNLLKKGVIICIPRDTTDEEAQALATAHATQPDRIGYVVCSEFEHITSTTEGSTNE